MQQRDNTATVPVSAHNSASGWLVRAPFCCRPSPMACRRRAEIRSPRRAPPIPSESGGGGLGQLLFLISAPLQLGLARERRQAQCRVTTAGDGPPAAGLSRRPPLVRCAVDAARQRGWAAAFEFANRTPTAAASPRDRRRRTGTDPRPRTRPRNPRPRAPGPSLGRPVWRRAPALRLQGAGLRWRSVGRRSGGRAPALPRPVPAALDRRGAVRRAQVRGAALAGSWGTEGGAHTGAEPSEAAVPHQRTRSGPTVAVHRGHITTRIGGGGQRLPACARWEGSLQAGHRRAKGGAAELRPPAVRAAFRVASVSSLRTVPWPTAAAPRLPAFGSVVSW